MRYSHSPPTGEVRSHRFRHRPEGPAAGEGRLAARARARGPRRGGDGSVRRRRMSDRRRALASVPPGGSRGRRGRIRPVSDPPLPNAQECFARGHPDRCWCSARVWSGQRRDLLRTSAAALSRQRSFACVRSDEPGSFRRLRAPFTERLRTGMASYRFASRPSEGEAIAFEQNALSVPNNPVIPYVEGDGTGPDIWRASVRVFDAAIEKAYGGERKVSWMKVYAGEESHTQHGEWLPDETLEAFKEFRVSIKGPLSTPVGGGIRSLNVTLRQVLDLYACIRPVRYFEGVGNPMKEPEKLNVVIFRENTEDVYAGIEWAAGSAEAEKLRQFIHKEFGKDVRAQSALGIKPMSEFGSKRLIEMAIRYALKNNLPSVTLVHKGNIMKFTEGAFRDWGYEVARDKFAETVCTEADLGKAGSHARADAVVIKDRIADAMFQQLLLRPDEYSVLACPNLNGDYISDAAAAQVGGLGIAPGGNVGDGMAVFEATHGTAPKYAGQDKVNPGSVILSGVMMFEYMGWDDVGRLIVRGLEHAIKSKRVTYDLARQMSGATEVPTSTFADQIIKGMSA